MLARADFLSLNFVKRKIIQAVTRNARYMPSGGGRRRDFRFICGRFCFDVTPEEQKISEMFPFSEDGLAQGIDWMNEQYESVRRHEK